MGMDTRRAVGPRCSTSGLSSAKGIGIPLYRIAAVTASKLGLVWGETAPEILVGMCMRRGLRWMGALMAPECQLLSMEE